MLESGTAAIAALVAFTDASWAEFFGLETAAETACPMANQPQLLMLLLLRSDCRIKFTGGEMPRARRRDN